MYWLTSHYSKQAILEFGFGAVQINSIVELYNAVNNQTINIDSEIKWITLIIPDNYIILGKTTHSHQLGSYTTLGRCPQNKKPETIEIS